MQALINWHGGPTGHEVTAILKLGCKKNRISTYSAHLLERILVVQGRSINGKEESHTLLLKKATPREIHDFTLDVTGYLIEQGLNSLEFVININGYPASAYALDSAVAAMKAIKLLRKAPRDKSVAEARHILQQALRRGLGPMQQ